MFALPSNEVTTPIKRNLVTTSKFHERKMPFADEYSIFYFNLSIVYIKCSLVVI